MPYAYVAMHHSQITCHGMAWHSIGIQPSLSRNAHEFELRPMYYVNARRILMHTHREKQMEYEIVSVVLFCCKAKYLDCIM